VAGAATKNSIIGLAASGLFYFIAIHFMLTLMMVLKRTHILVRSKLGES
jgi:hypothetical protein